MDQIEPVLGRRWADDLKMASAVTIAAVLMVPAILAFAFVAWLYRTLSKSPLRTKLP